MAPRTILYTGKGGVGKTSVAAATARRCAAAGLRTVVLSTDPAHSLSDSLEADLSSTPTPCGDSLWGQEVQAQEEMERHWEAVQEWMGDLLAERGVDRIAAEELTVPPGMDELFSLLQIKRHHESGEFDAIIVDCAPTGETLRLLSFPDVASWWLEKMIPLERKMMGAARPLARAMLDISLPSDKVFDDVERLVQNLVAMNVILRNRATTSIRLVMNPDRMVIKESMRTFTYLNLYGYLTDAVVVNRVFPPEVEGGYFGAWRAVQTEQMDLVRSGFGPVPILTGAVLRPGGGRRGDARPAGGRGVRRSGRGRAALRRPVAGARLRQRRRDAAARDPVRGEGRRRAEEDRPRGDRPGGRAEAHHHPAADDGRVPPAGGAVRGRCAERSIRTS